MGSSYEFLVQINFRLSTACHVTALRKNNYTIIFIVDLINVFM